MNADELRSTDGIQVQVVRQGIGLMGDPDFTSAFEFPCDFPLKVIGHAADDFEAFAVSIVRKHVPEADMGAVVSRSSHGGKYLALTINFTAQSRPQLEALYLELGQSGRILVAL